MVKIRLARWGAKKRPYYHIVVADSQSPRDGKFLEQIGTYDPSKPAGEAKVDRGRLEHWLSVGAQVTPSLKKVFNEHRKAQAATS